MKKMTIFTAPKPFVDPHIDLIQRNAIGSWLQMGNDVEVLLMGDEAGIAEAARDFKVTHVENVKKNEQGTPLISSIFEKANEISEASSLMFVNSDMLLLPETKEMTSRVQKDTAKFILL